MNEWESHVTPRSIGSGAVVEQVWRLSRDPEGCRVVQELLADTASALGAELKGHVWEALRCPNANHVLQKAISLAGDSLSRLVIGALLARRQASLWVSCHPACLRVWVSSTDEDSW